MSFRAFGLALIVWIATAMPGRAADVRQQIAEGAKTALMSVDRTTDGILTLRDGNQFVQCLATHFLKTWRCEAAGLEGQPWLRHALTAERQAKLAGLGFKPDPKLGNFLVRIPKTIEPGAMANLLYRALTEGYGVKPEDIAIKAEELAAQRCHQRIMANHELGGLIRTPTIGLERDAAPGCGIDANYDAANYDDPKAVILSVQGIDVDARYLPAMTAELRRLETVADGVDAFSIFIAGPAYVQCMHDGAGQRMYCEAASEDAVGKPVERILTPERKAKLLAAGFAPPGKTMNYSRFYPAGQYDMAALAKTLLGILKDAYGYRGAPPMRLTTETLKEQPLAP